MPRSVAVVMVVLLPLGLLGAYLGHSVAPTLLLCALTVVMLREIQARWLSREERVSLEEEERPRPVRPQRPGAGGDRRHDRSAARSARPAPVGSP